MARTTQTRKRSRPYSYNRPAKRRRFVRRRRKYGTITSKASRPSSYGWRNRRLTKRKIRDYKRSLWTVSNTMNKFHVGFAAAHTIAASADLTIMKRMYFKIGQSNAAGDISLTNATSWVSDRGNAAMTGLGDNVIVRGGMSKIVMSQEANECVEYIVRLIKVINEASAPTVLTESSVARDQAPFFGNDESNDVKILKSYTGFLEATTGVKFMWKHPLANLDPAKYDDGVAYYWVVDVAGSFNAATLNVSVIREETFFVCTSGGTFFTDT